VFEHVRRWLPLVLVAPVLFVGTHQAAAWWTARSTRLVSPPQVVVPALAGSAPTHRSPGSPRAEPNRSQTSSATSRTARPSGTGSRAKPSPPPPASQADADPARATDVDPDRPLVLDPVTGTGTDPVVDPPPPDNASSDVP
jgi:hypothetical protein